MKAHPKAQGTPAWRPNRQNTGKHPNAPNFPSLVCQFYQSGKCKYGNECRSLHRGEPTKNYTGKEAVYSGPIESYYQSNKEIQFLPVEAPYRHRPNEKDSIILQGTGTKLHSALQSVEHEETVLSEQFRAAVKERRETAPFVEFRPVNEPNEEFVYSSAKGNCVVAVDPQIAQRFNDAFEFEHNHTTGTATLRVHVIDMPSLLTQETDREAQTNLVEFHATVQSGGSQPLFDNKGTRELFSFSTEKLCPAITVEVKVNDNESLSGVLSDPEKFNIFRSQVQLSERVTHENPMFERGIDLNVNQNDSPGVQSVKRLYNYILPYLKKTESDKTLRTTESVAMNYFRHKIDLEYIPIHQESRLLTSFLVRSVFGAAFTHAFEKHTFQECVPCFLRYGRCQPPLKTNTPLLEVLRAHDDLAEIAPKALSYLDDDFLRLSGVGLTTFVKHVKPTLYEQCFEAEGTYTTLKEAKENGWEYSFVLNKPSREYTSIVALEMMMNFVEGKACRWCEHPDAVIRLISDANTLLKIKRAQEQLVPRELMKVVLDYRRSVRDSSPFLVPGFSIKKKNGMYDIFLPQMDYTIRDVPSKGLRDGGKLWLAVNPCEGCANIAIVKT
ncbi:hypothetical protein, conserved [Angomonas deanei]|uniref:C3H1-type domain-containing protein n=1 Tax=Angomonas deanei TaxID=59799 RepID=A0A7G2CA04_9TRYP|nr:hypothetical protein, conserved [Angomonas deanei]